MRIAAHRIGIAGMALLGALYWLWPVWRAMFPLEIDIDEPWNAYRADAVFGPDPLYPPPAGLIANNYPPLSFVTIAGLARVTGLDALLVGRILSMLAVLVIAAAVAACVRSLGGSRGGAALGAIWFASLLPRAFDAYVGKNDPHLLALAIMAVALAWCLRRARAGRDPLPALLLMVLAGFYKHSLIAIPTTALLSLAATHRQWFWRGALVSAAAAIAGLLACVAVFGSDFLGQLLFPRVHSLGRSLRALERLNAVAPALVILGIWIWHDRRSDAARFSMLFFGTAFASFLVLKTGEGLGENALLELTFACAIGLGLAFDRLPALGAVPAWIRGRARTAIPLILCVGLLALPNAEIYQLLVSAEYRDEFRRNSEVAHAEAARVAAIAPPVVCSVQTVCRQAGMAQVTDPFFVQQKMATRRMSEADLAARLGNATYVVIDPRATIHPLRRRAWLRRWVRQLLGRPPEH